MTHGTVYLRPIELSLMMTDNRQMNRNQALYLLLPRPLCNPTLQDPVGKRPPPFSLEAVMTETGIPNVAITTIIITNDNNTAAATTTTTTIVTTTQHVHICQFSVILREGKAGDGRGHLLITPRYFTRHGRANLSTHIWSKHARACLGR